jgi:hypothetical protein
MLSFIKLLIKLLIKFSQKRYILQNMFIFETFMLSIGTQANRNFQWRPTNKKGFAISNDKKLLFLKINIPVFSFIGLEIGQYGSV